MAAVNSPSWLFSNDINVLDGSSQPHFARIPSPPLSRAAPPPVVLGRLHKTDEISLPNFIHFSAVAEKSILSTRQHTHMHAHTHSCSECFSTGVNHRVKGRQGNKTSCGGSDGCWAVNILRLHAATRAEERKDAAPHARIHRPTRCLVSRSFSSPARPQRQLESTVGVQACHAGIRTQTPRCRTAEPNHRELLSGLSTAAPGRLAAVSLLAAAAPEAELRPCRGHWRKRRVPRAQLDGGRLTGAVCLTVRVRNHPHEPTEVQTLWRRCVLR